MQNIVAKTYLIKNAKLYNEQKDILVKDGIIAGIAPSGTENFQADLANVNKNTETRDANIKVIDENIEIIDASNLLVFPSFIDVHVHLRDPGQEWKETIETGLTAAAHGGFGTIFCMANTKPVNDCAAITKEMIAKAEKHFPYGPKLYPVGALTVGLKGKELAPLHELQMAGCKSFSNDGYPMENSALFSHAMEYAADLNAIVIDHCEDPYFAVGAGINEGKVSAKLGLKAQADIAEALQVARDILLAEYLDIPVHIAHVSSKKSVYLLRDAKKRNIKITAETTPHYVHITEDCITENYNTEAKVNPPLRTQEDVQILREAIADGTIDIFATDHAPHAQHEKEVEFAHAPCGISGLDAAVSLTWQLVEEKVMSVERFIDAWAYRAAKIFSLPVNNFKVGDSADFSLFDPNEKWMLSPDNMHSKGKNTPFLNKELKGRIKSHFLAGRKVI